MRRRGRGGAGAARPGASRRWSPASSSGADAAMVKLFCTELQARVVDRCLQLFGGYGYITEFPIARLYADARVTRIYGGTSEVMKSIISKSLGLLRREATDRRSAHLHGSRPRWSPAAPPVSASATARELVARGATVVLLDLPAQRRRGSRPRSSATRRASSPADITDDGRRRGGARRGRARRARCGPWCTARDAAETGSGSSTRSSNPGRSTRSSRCSGSTWSAPTTCCGWRPRR